jgi:cysteine desulfurase
MTQTSAPHASALRSISLDHHTHSRVSQTVLDRMIPYFHERSPQIDLSPIYELVDAASEDTFVFTSSAAEAVAQVIWSVFSEVSVKEGKTHFLTSCIEDAPTLQMLKRCETFGCLAKIAPVDASGRIDLKEFEAMITPRTALVTITLAQGLTGVIQPIEEICRIAKERNVLVHLEGSYAIGNAYFSFQNSPADYLTFSGERLHGVKGSGALFAKKGRPLVPFIAGGSMRGGQLDAPSLAALAAAASLSTLALDTIGLEGARMRDLFETEIQAMIPDAKVLFKESHRLPNTTSILFPRVHAEALRYYLQRKGLYSNSSGAYCQHLHRLLASSSIQTESALSFSLCRMTTQEEILQAAARICEEVVLLQKLSEDLF